MSTKEFSVNRKPKVTSREQLDGMSREELVEKIIQLEAHNTQLKNLLQKKLNGDSSSQDHKEGKKRSFDFSKSFKRHLLLKFLYFGWNYQGYAQQEDTNETIEYHLFNALQKTCLIESRETSNYNRCGRTDKGVSAFGQVISIDLRSKFPELEQMVPANIDNEIDYCSILNRVLPKNIRCIAWMPLRNKLFSARFDCSQRTYRYFFPEGNLDIAKMKKACEALIGTHDFRNLCKMDVNNGVTNFTRKVISADIHKSCTENTEKGYDMYYLEIVGHAFLWHQIRCIMAVLVLIGQGNEDPSIITELLDVERNSCKPQYTLASPLPLNLYSSEFKEKSSQTLIEGSESEEEKLHINEVDITEWQFSEDNLKKLVDDLQQNWSHYSIKATMVREILNDLQSVYSEKFSRELPECQANILQEGVRQKVYQKLLTRKRCESLEQRIDHYVKKQRIFEANNSDGNKAIV
ncbi:unnamed protein product [Hermetia illucens]|uniref:Pseudouridine synthase I TruA alpha/beta domain-containing protein n=1 Tax=Hermetia illucens TaxID=343691 RepID=A0A7R8UWM3_HERIL|nr:tRNA pseudouridine(38/39) synthase [Hermetia illucens]CAD7088444.1 unnamed protein product [Hermetia illucens]